MKPSDYINAAGTPDETMRAMLERIAEVLDRHELRLIVRDMRDRNEDAEDINRFVEHWTSGELNAELVNEPAPSVSSSFDPVTQRITTDFEVLVYDKETVQRLRNARGLTAEHFRTVDAGEHDDTEGLPPFADGSRWDGERLVDGGHYTRPSFWIQDDELNSDDDRMPSLSTVRHLLASHDRANGCYWADHFRALASELLEEAEAVESRWPALLERFPPALPSFEEASVVREKRDAAHRILAVIDDLRENGVCG